MKTILVSGASGIVGYGTLRSLRVADEKYNLIGTSIYTDSIAPIFCDSFERAPLTVDPHYIDWLCEIIAKHKVDMIIPGINDDMLAWNENRDRLDQTGTMVMLNSSELIDLCADKWTFYEYLKSRDSGNLIETRLEGTFAELTDAYGLPFLLKPRQGFASKGIVIVKNEEIFDAHKSNIGAVLMAQPIVGTNDSEYTISAFFDRESNLCSYMSLSRQLSKEGFTEKAQVATPANAQAVIQELANNLHPVGPTNFQFRIHDSKLKLLEINPRISSATSIRTGFGYNESAMAVQYFLDGVTPVQSVIQNGSAIRYTEDHFIYDSADL